MIPQAVDAVELHRHLTSYLQRVAAGDSFLITRRGKVIARLAPENDPAAAAYQRLLSYRGQGWVGAVLTPLDEEWTGDSDHV
jgi:antitoxin (DNA-binding transcriptional repressor) of toxin-antitoxin stability system